MNDVNDRPSDVRPAEDLAELLAEAKSEHEAGRARGVVRG
jgi:hypothetical protein